MQLKETKKKGLLRSYKMTITATELDAKVTRKIEESRGDIQIKGFRKGHVPINLLKKMYGKSILGEAMQETVDESVKEHFTKTGDKPAMQPEIKMLNDDWKEGENMDVSIEYEKLPEIPETDFSKIKLRKLVAKVDKGSVDEALANLASSSPNFKNRPKTGKAKSGDQLLIDFSGSVDGVDFDGGKAEDYPLVLGSNSFIPGFEEQLVGVRGGEELNLKVKFPDDYGSDKLAGKAAVFNVKVKSVGEPKPAAINDDLAKKFGAADLKTLKEQITERLKGEFSVATRALLKRELLDKIDESVNFEIPTKLLENEANQIANQLWHEENPDAKNPDPASLKPNKEHKKLAERRVKLGLLLAELGSQNKITVSDQETQSALKQKAREYPGQEKAFFDFIEKNPQAKEQMKAPVFEEKVVDFILELTKISEKTVSKDDLKKAVEKLESV